MKPGFASSEFYAVIAAKIVSALIVFGVLSASQSDQWQTAIGNAMIGAVAIWQLVSMAKAYVEARTSQKHAVLGAASNKPNEPPSRSSGGSALKAALWFLVLVGMFAAPGLASAQAPAVRESVATFGYRRQLENRLKNLEKGGQQQAPAPAAPQSDPAPATSILIQQLGQQIAQLQATVQAMQLRQSAPASPAPAPQAAPQAAPVAPQFYYLPSPNAPTQPQMQPPQYAMPINPPQQVLPIAPPQYIIPIQPPQYVLPIQPQQQVLPIHPPQFQIVPQPARPAQPQALPAAPQMQLPGPVAPVAPLPAPVVPAPLIGPPQQLLPAPAPSGYQRFATWRPPARTAR
jgi:hypothetical protein